MDQNWPNLGICIFSKRSHFLAWLSKEQKSAVNERTQESQMCTYFLATFYKELWIICFMRAITIVVSICRKCAQLQTTTFMFAFEIFSQEEIKSLLEACQSCVKNRQRYFVVLPVVFCLLLLNWFVNFRSLQLCSKLIANEKISKNLIKIKPSVMFNEAKVDIKWPFKE